MKIIQFIFSALASIIIFILLFMFIFHKPLTVNTIQEYLQYKISYLNSIDSTKIIVLAGSNGRFSHSCETIEKEIGIPCSNMSLASEIPLDYQFEKIKPSLNPGDVIYLPLEYNMYNLSLKKMMSGLGTPHIVANDRNYLLKMNFKQLLYTLFYFDIKSLITSIFEMSLKNLDEKRLYNLNTLTIQGDESGHTLIKAQKYNTKINNLGWLPPSQKKFNESSYGIKIIKDFLSWAKSNGVVIVGGLPTTFNDKPISDKLIKDLQHFYTKYGHSCIVLENISQYPRNYFYDSSYHLAEEYQIQHSEMCAKYLKIFFED